MMVSLLEGVLKKYGLQKYLCSRFGISPNSLKKNNCPQKATQETYFENNRRCSDQVLLRFCYTAPGQTLYKQEDTAEDWFLAGANIRGPQTLRFQQSS